MPPTQHVSPRQGPPPGSHQVPTHPAIVKLDHANEQTYMLIGTVSEQMGELDRAMVAYEHALRHNPHSLQALTQVAGIARAQENYPKAVDHFQRVLSMQPDNGEVWSSLGHCHLMQDDLQKAYSAYQQALYLLPNPKEDPKLWYGIGILYDRYGSLDHAEDAFRSVLDMDKDFDKANEILFRLGIIYKQQSKFDESLRCFDRILRNPPNPLAHGDIWFQIGHVYEQQKDYNRAKEAYEHVVRSCPQHAKVLQQLGWLYHQDGSSFQDQDRAIEYLTKSLEADATDAQSWYLLGRAYMVVQKYNKAYEAYQQAVYRDSKNPTFWCSIGVLYFQINQYRDALDAYSRAIRINPFISEVWFDLGSLYESCNNQISDAIDAYARASELDPSNASIASRLQLLRKAQASGQMPPAPPGPQDVHPTAYANTVGPPSGLPPGAGALGPGPLAPGQPAILQAPRNGSPSNYRATPQQPPHHLAPMDASAHQQNQQQAPVHPRDFPASRPHAQAPPNPGPLYEGGSRPPGTSMSPPVAYRDRERDAREVRYPPPPPPDVRHPNSGRTPIQERTEPVWERGGGRDRERERIERDREREHRDREEYAARHHARNGSHSGYSVSPVYSRRDQSRSPPEHERPAVGYHNGAPTPGPAPGTPSEEPVSRRYDPLFAERRRDRPSPYEAPRDRPTEGESTRDRARRRAQAPKLLEKSRESRRRGASSRNYAEDESMSEPQSAIPHPAPSKSHGVPPPPLVFAQSGQSQLPPPPSSSSRRIVVSPTNSTGVPAPPGQPPAPPNRYVDEDYDEGVPDIMMALSRGRGEPANGGSNMKSPTTHSTHRDSISSGSHHSPPPPSSGASTIRNAVSPRPAEPSTSRRVNSPGVGKASSPPLPSTRPSPIPFRHPPLHNLDSLRDNEPQSAAPKTRSPTHSHHSSNGTPPTSAGANKGASFTLPPIATLSPVSNGPDNRGSTPAKANTNAAQDDQMAVDEPSGRLAKSQSTSPHPQEGRSGGGSTKSSRPASRTDVPMDVESS